MPRMLPGHQPAGHLVAHRLIGDLPPQLVLDIETWQLGKAAGGRAGGKRRQVVGRFGGIGQRELERPEQAVAGPEDRHGGIHLRVAEAQALTVGGRSGGDAPVLEPERFDELPAVRSDAREGDRQGVDAHSQVVQDRFPEERLARDEVQDVVEDLKRHAEGVTIRAERAECGWGETRAQSADIA
jgi:hypothetical protein